MVLTIVGLRSANPTYGFGKVQPCCFSKFFMRLTLVMGKADIWRFALGLSDYAQGANPTFRLQYVAGQDGRVNLF